MSSRSARPQGDQHTPAAGYERRDANPNWIFGIVGGLLLAGLAIHFILAGLMGSLRRTPPPTDRWHPAGRAVAPPSDFLPAVPSLQTAPAQDLESFRGRETAELNSYGWINKTSGVVRIPIRHAMDLLLTRGFPDQKKTNSAETGPSSYDLQLRRPLQRQPEIQERP